MSLDFETAAKLAQEQALKLLPNAKDFSLEGIMLDNTNNYEVSLSYLIQSKDSLGSQPNENSGISTLLKIMGTRREEKVFIISQNGDFKGFRNLK